MNKKALLLVGIVACLVAFVPLVVAQAQNGSIPQTGDQTHLQIRDCDESCVLNQTACNGCWQNQTCLQDRQCLQTCDCDENCVGEGTGICGGVCDGIQTRQRLCQQEGIQVGLIGGQHCGGQGLGKNCQIP